MDALIGNLREVDIRRLRIFMTIVECGGFVPAQNELGLSASTVSLRMTELEARLGLRLCHRGRRGFSITPEGESVYTACQSLLRAHENFISEVGAARGVISGELRVGIIDNLIFDPNLAFSRVLADYSEQASDLEISLYTMAPTDLERALLEHRLQLAIGVFYNPVPDLQYHSLFHERLLLYCGKGHSLFKARKNSLSIDRLQQVDYVERTYGQTISRLNKPLPLKSAAYSSSLEAAAILIQTGKYVGFLPQYYAQQWCDQGLMKPLLADEIYIDSVVSAAVHKQPQNETMTRGLLDSLVDNIKIPLSVA